MTIIIFSPDQTSGTDVSIPLQVALDAVSGTESGLDPRDILDLDGKSWVYKSQLTFKDTIHIRNGQLIYDGPDYVTTLLAKPVNGKKAVLIMENVRIHSKRHKNKKQVGLQIEEGFRVRLQRVDFTNWRNCGIALRLEGVQYGRFEDCKIEDSHTSMVITGYVDGPPSTALTFTHCQFRGHLGEGPSVIILPYIEDSKLSSGARTCVFEHCYFENARDGAGGFVEADSTRFLTLLNCHFEKAGDDFSHIELLDQDSMALSNRILYCIFSNTKPLVDNIPHIRIGSNVNRTLLIGNTHAVTTPAVEDNGTNTVIQ